MKKIIARMRGGLGNQLFILAFAYKIANELKNEDYEIVLDIREYKNYKIRNFEILNMISDNKIRMYDDNKDKSTFYDVSRKFYHVIQKILPPNMPIMKLLANNGLLYSKRSAECIVPKNKDRIYLYGYFQDEEMVRTVRTTMLEKIKFSNVDKELLNNEIKNIAVSIRCGEDYIKKGWPVCSEKFYRNAINEIINEKYENEKYHVWIFSDDIEKARKMNLCDNATYVENKSAIEQINMMYYCNDFVMSNSSFSWWGTYFGKKDDSIIIAPMYWYPNNCKTENSLLNYNQMKIKNWENEEDFK